MSYSDLTKWSISLWNHVYFTFRVKHDEMKCNRTCHVILKAIICSIYYHFKHIWKILSLVWSNRGQTFLFQSKSNLTLRSLRRTSRWMDGAACQNPKVTPPAGHLAVLPQYVLILSSLINCVYSYSPPPFPRFFSRSDVYVLSPACSHSPSFEINVCNCYKCTMNVRLPVKHSNTM